MNLKKKTHIKQYAYGLCFNLVKQWTALASELPFSFHLAAKGKCPPEGLQAQNTANWLTSEPTFAYLPTHMFIARIKGLPIFSWKIIIESFGLFDYHYFFPSKCMSGRSAQWPGSRLQNYFRKTHFASKVRAILQHCTISFWLDSYLICTSSTTIHYVLLMYVPQIILVYGPILYPRAQFDQRSSYTKLFRRS